MQKDQLHNLLQVTSVSSNMNKIEPGDISFWN